MLNEQSFGECVISMTEKNNDQKISAYVQAGSPQNCFCHHVESSSRIIVSMAKMDISIVRRLALRLGQASTLGEWKISERGVQFPLLSWIRI